MLYNLKWGSPSLASFIAWLETKPSSEHYDFGDCKGGCLLGQYMAFIGIPWGKASPLTWVDTPYFKTAEQVFGPLDNFPVLHSRPWTFGAALARAREFAHPAQ